MEEHTNQRLIPVREAGTDPNSAIGKDDNTKRTPADSRMPFPLRMAKTCAMAAIYLGLGLNTGIRGPTLLDLSGLYTEGNVEDLSRAVSLRPVGMLLGSFLGALLSDRFRKKADLILSLVVLTSGVLCAATPMMPHLAVLGLAYFTRGVCQGIITVACSSIMIAVWGDDAAAPLHALQIGYSVGSTVSQPIGGLFVVSNQEAITASGDFHPHNYTDLEHGRAAETQIYIPYGVFGAYQVLVSFVFLGFYLLGLTYTSTTVKTRKSFREMLHPSSCSGGRGGFGLYMLVSIFFIYIGTVARETIMGLFVCPIGTMVFKMSGFTASLLGLAYNVSFLAGRLTGMILALFVRIQLMVFLELSSVLVLMAILAIWGTPLELGFWLLVCSVGFFMGPNYPSIMAWVDRYIEATGFVVAIIDIGVGTGGFLSTVVGGVLLEHQGPNSLLYLHLAACLFIMAVIVPLQIVSNKAGDRHDKADDSGVSWCDSEDVEQAMPAKTEPV